MIVYLSTNDIAKRLGVSHSAVSHMKRRGQLPEPDAQIADRYGWTGETMFRWFKDREAKR
jgi:hypothetical protein